jgi:hypothetical protein
MQDEGFAVGFYNRAGEAISVLQGDLIREESRRKRDEDNEAQYFNLAQHDVPPVAE